MKLLITDLDGTLIDTTKVNFLAYQEALNGYGIALDYPYFCQYCNGKNYREFLPPVISGDIRLIEKVHDKKKELYNKYINEAIINERLVDIIRLLRVEYKTALVSTASKDNCMTILDIFDLRQFFDLIITQEDVEHLKPDSEGFFKAMDSFDSTPRDTLIFEDSETGLMAAEKTNACVFRTFGFNGCL